MYPTRYANPKAVGYIIRQLVRCGDPACRCARRRCHEAFYLVYRVRLGGRWRQRKRYVRRADVPELRRRLAATKACDRAMRGLLDQSRRLRRAFQSKRRGRISNQEFEEIVHAINNSTNGESRRRAAHHDRRQPVS